MMRQFAVTGETIDYIHNNGTLGVTYSDSEEAVLENEPVIFSNGSQSALCIRHGDLFHLVPDHFPVILQPRNAEQRVALYLLLSQRVPLVTLIGRAGSGKTLLAISAAMHELEKNKYKRILVARPNVTLGDAHELGYLKGDLYEKLDPLMAPIYDNLAVLKTDRQKIKKMISDYHVEFTPLSYIRGRSLNDVFVIVDEAQNLTPEEIKTIGTRIGTNCKLVFTADLDQIDIRSLRPDSNSKPRDGISHLLERAKDHPLVSHVRLRKSERSPLCDLLSEVL